MVILDLSDLRQTLETPWKNRALIRSPHSPYFDKCFFMLLLDYAIQVKITTWQKLDETDDIYGVQTDADGKVTTSTDYKVEGAGSSESGSKFGILVVKLLYKR